MLLRMDDAGRCARYVGDGEAAAYQSEIDAHGEGGSGKAVEAGGL